MSINWVMLAPTSNPPYTPLDSENPLYTSPPRVALSITTPSHFPGKQQAPFTVTSASGTLHLTNRRIIYLPDKPSPQLQSFATPLLNLHDSHVTAPFFGPNAWIALLQPVQGGGIPVPATGVVELKLTFKDGGAFDYHTAYERVRERLQQTMDVARMDGGGGGGDGAQAATSGVDVSNVGLDELPAYKEESDGPLLSPASRIPPPRQSGGVVHGLLGDPPGHSRGTGAAAAEGSAAGSGPPAPGGPPTEPPPGYEEAQMQGLQDGVDRKS